MTGKLQKAGRQREERSLGVHEQGIDSLRVDATPDEEFCQNELFDLLGNRRRRYILYYLSLTETPTTSQRLAETVAAWENDTSVENVTSNQYQSVYNSFYQTHFPKLEEAGLVRYDRSKGLVSQGARFDDIDPFLRADDEEKSPSYGVADHALFRYGLIVVAAVGGLAFLSLPLSVELLLVETSVVVVSLAFAFR